MVALTKIKQLRKETEISITECKKALEEARGDIQLAKEILRKRGKEWAKKKAEREMREGIVASYIHPNKKIGVLLELNCETDFVAESQDFQNLAHELCLQIAAMRDEIPLFQQPWIRDENRTIKDLVQEYIAKLGENIAIKRFVRYEL